MVRGHGGFTAEVVYAGLERPGYGTHGVCDIRWACMLTDGPSSRRVTAIIARYTSGAPSHGGVVLRPEALHEALLDAAAEPDTTIYFRTCQPMSSRNAYRGNTIRHTSFSQIISRKLTTGMLH